MAGERAAVERRAARALSLLIQQATVSTTGDGAFTQMHTVLRELFPRFFACAECETVLQRNLLIRLPGTGGAQPLLFLGHMDVAPVRKTENWLHPPFSGDVREGFVYGRGAADMKGHLTALLTAAEGLLAENWRPGGDLWFAFSADEEIRGAGMQQMCRLLLSHGVVPALTLDEGGSITTLPSLCEKEIALVGVQEKGRMRFTLTAEGTRAPEALLRASERLTQMHFTPVICPATMQTLSAVSNEMTGFMRFAAAHPRLCRMLLHRVLDKTYYGRALTRTQVMVSALRGDALRGEEAGVTFQASIVPGDSAGELLERVERVIHDERVLVTVDVMDEPSMYSPAEGAAWEALKTAIMVHFPHTVIAPYLLTGSSDARRMEQLCPYIYRFSPFILPQEELARVHGANERLSIENLLRGTAFFRQMLMA